MLELLTDLDRGVDKLPRGSEVILLNTHDTDEIARHVKRLGRWNGLAVRHIKGNPLHIEDLKKVGKCTRPNFMFKGLKSLSKIKGMKAMALSKPLSKHWTPWSKSHLKGLGGK